jgi:hypothetical protein
MAEKRMALGALVVVAAGLLLVGRFVIRNETLEHAEPAETGETAEPKTSSPAPASPTAATSAKKARYESALVDASIFGLSSGAGTALAVGDGGAIFRHKVDDAKWTKMDAPAKDALRAVAQQVDEAIAVGDGGVILEMEGDAWKSVASPTKRTLRAVVYTSYGAVAVGDGGTIVRRLAPHMAWQTDASGTGSDLFGACAGLRDVWLAGSAGTVVSRGEDAWKVHASLGAVTLRAVACDDHAAIAVGDKGALFERLDDVDWHASASNVAVDLFAVSAPLGTTSFTVVGAAGTVVHVTRDASAEMPVLSFDLRAVTEGALGTWVAGERGVFRRVPQ